MRTPAHLSIESLRQDLHSRHSHRTDCARLAASPMAAAAAAAVSIRRGDAPATEGALLWRTDAVPAHSAPSLATFLLLKMCSGERELFPLSLRPPLNQRGLQDKQWMANHSLLKLLK